MKLLIWIALKIYYFNWSKLYRAWQRHKIRSGYDVIVSATTNTAKTIFKQQLLYYHTTLMELKTNWKSLLQAYSYVYKSDTPAMLWDVIGDAYLELFSGGNDCDGYANIALTFMPDNIKIDDIYYCKQGFITLLPNKPHKGGGHCTSVWANKEETAFIIVSNTVIMQFKSKKEIIEWWDVIMEHEYGLGKQTEYLIEYGEDFQNLKINSRKEILK